MNIVIFLTILHDYSFYVYNYKSRIYIVKLLKSYQQNCNTFHKLFFFIRCFKKFGHSKNESVVIDQIVSCSHTLPFFIIFTDILLLAVETKRSF